MSTKNHVLSLVIQWIVYFKLKPFAISINQNHMLFASTKNLCGSYHYKAKPCTVYVNQKPCAIIINPHHVLSVSRKNPCAIIINYTTYCLHQRKKNNMCWHYKPKPSTVYVSQKPCAIITIYHSIKLKPWAYLFGQWEFCHFLHAVEDEFHKFHHVLHIWRLCLSLATNCKIGICPWDWLKKNLVWHS